MDDNIFDDDDALDYIIYEECEKEVNSSKSNGGCLSSIIFVLVSPAAALIFFAMALKN